MNKRKRLGWVGGVLGLLLVLALLAWLRLVYFGRPDGLMKDIRAGLAARDIADPDQRLLKYLQGRYGDLDDPAVRRQVFLDFFDPERIKTLQMLVKRAPEERRQASIDAMARWVARYRANLSAEERAELSARFRTPEGRAQLGRATAQYNAQDVHYRGQTAPVISELLRTLNEVGPAP
jgi:hypothetical protein